MFNFRILLLFFLGAGLAFAGCTERNDATHVGHEGFPCYKGACDPGLACLSGFCVPGGTLDRGTADSGLDGVASDLPPVAWDLRSERIKQDLPSCSPRPAKPVLDKYPATTGHLKVVLRGQAQGAASVRVSGASTSTSAKVSGGRFCAEVQLAATYAVQSFVVSSINSKGCASAGVKVSVTYKPTSGDINLLANKVGRAYYKANFAGYSPTTLGLLTDGKLSSAVTFTVQDSTTNCDRYTWFWYDLQAAQTMKKIVIKYPSNTLRYLTCWKLVGSNKSSPGLPRTSGSDWTVLLQSTNGTPNSLDLNLVANAQKYRHYAVLMYENNEYNTTYEHFSIVEVEGWGKQAPPSCGQ